MYNHEIDCTAARKKETGSDIDGKKFPRCHCRFPRSRHAAQKHILFSDNFFFRSIFILLYTILKNCVLHKRGFTALASMGEGEPLDYYIPYASTRDEMKNRKLLYFLIVIDSFYSSILGTYCNRVFALTSSKVHIEKETKNYKFKQFRNK